MAQQWMGFTISIDCGPMGVFQGVVTAVEAEPQSVTLSRAFHNGIPHTSPSIVISAHDIKDLTIIAAPQAQLDPVVELKKPIPTRPERNVNDSSHNFHSQPAPPRALHLCASELDPRKAAVLQDYEERTQRNNNGPLHPPSQAGAALFARSPQRASEQLFAQAVARHQVQLSALQAALPSALKITVANQAAALASSVVAGQAQGPVKLNAAQVVSKRASQLSTAQTLKGNNPAPPRDGASHAASGGFKITAALEAQGAQRTNQVSPQKSKTSLQEKMVAAAAQGASGGSRSLKEAQASSSRPPQVPALKSLQLATSEPSPLSSAAQALFHRAAPQMSPQGASALPLPQAGAAHNSPQKNARGAQLGAASVHSLQVNADGYASGSGDGNRTPNRRDRLRQRWQARDEACFGSPANGFDQEFDFEKNLALFDKQAVYDEIAVQRPDLVQPANDQRRQQNYRHDQNIIVNNRRIPTIIVPNPGSAEYVTDEGLIIPSMRPELLRQLHQKAHDVGFTYDRQSEVFARCATEMSLQLLGGAHRLNPHNSHQWPTVIVMVGPHSQGAAGVMCARQLECQGVSTVTLVVNEAAAPQPMKRELNFYKCGGAPIVHSTDELPDTVDLVIMALAGHLPSDVANSLEYGKAASWASNKRATVLALDPPPVGTPGIITKFALAPTLPVTYSPQNGKIYLCNLGIPVVVFKEMGIRYRSPFGSKFVIPLHPNDE